MSYLKSRALNQFSTLDFFCTVSGKVINLRSHWFAVALSACGDKKGTRVRIPDSPAAVSFINGLSNTVATVHSSEWEGA